MSGETCEFGTSDEYTSLKWHFTEHWSGEWATFEICGLRAYVRDYDGDESAWTIRKGKRGPILASGSRHDGIHFFECLRDAETALRGIIASRIAALRSRSPAPVPTAREEG